jgi:cytoskeleton protein RodZ
METLGGKLCHAREQRGLQIAQVAEQLRLNAGYLEAMERDDVKSLPGGFFSRSFYRQYAGLLGLLDSQLEAEVSRLLADEAEPPLPGQDRPREGSDLPPIRTLALRRSPGARRPLISVALLLIVMAACAGLYELWQRARQGSTPSSIAGEASSRSPSSQPSPPAVRDNPPVVEVRTAEQGQEAGGGLALNLAASERTWVSVTLGGKVIYSGVLQPSQTKTLPGA